MNCSQCSSPVPESSNFCLTCGADLSEPGGGSSSVSDIGGLIRRLSQAAGGRYRITRAIGRGGMGAVFLAEDTTLERPVAIKALLPETSGNTNLIDRFQREARTAAKLDHPNIIPIYSVESDGELHFFVMKYVAGEPLDDVLRKGALSIEETQTLLWEAASALAHAHKRGVVHRDIKPGNILIEQDGRVLLADFGISKAMQSATQLTGTGQVVGTPHYMSPEQAKGEEIDGRSDQYSLAIMGYQMITGRLPFADEAIHTVIFKHVSVAPEPLSQLRPDTPPFLATAIHRALAKHPDDRFPSMGEFAEAIFPGRKRSGSVESFALTTGERRVSHLSVAPTEIADRSDKTLPTPMPAVSTGGARHGRKRKWAPAILAVLFVVGGAGGSGYVAWSSGLIGSRGEPAESNVQLAQQFPAVAAPPPTDSATAESAPGAGERNLGPEESEAAPMRGTDSPVPATPVIPERTAAPTPPADRTGQGARRPAAQRLANRELRLEANPFATVFVDDVEIGETPITRHAVSVGRHVFRLERPGCETVVDTLAIPPGLRPFNRRWRLTCSK